MYDWRKMTPEERLAALDARQKASRPWHRPPLHLHEGWVHLTAACYQHVPRIGFSPERMEAFASDWLDLLHRCCREVGAWVLLPNHYHALVLPNAPDRLRRDLGQLHGRSSHTWNVEEQSPGRQCFHSASLRKIKCESHRWSTLNYIHNNPVKHKYVSRWQDWPWSSAHTYLQRMGRSEAERIWKAYPVTGMGDGWDED